ncbi:MAG TPA: hypothetical protein DEP87_03055 [Candidatus Pacebacteria bacterium]|nr:hypothetical protein [Candidatus Paceibacterota bacterium]
MNKTLAEVLKKSLGMPYEQLVREEYEMVVLKHLFESPVGMSLVFKGGTALRLAYVSPRFSEDLDFSVTDNFEQSACDLVLQELPKLYRNLKIKDLRQKFNTYFALFQIHEDFLTQDFSIKFEASTRPTTWQKDKNYTLQNLTSAVTPLTVLGQVASLESIEVDKIAIEPKRVRDVFDLWFIGQKLGKSATMDFTGFDPMIVRRELHKFLPAAQRRMITAWLPEN